MPTRRETFGVGAATALALLARRARAADDDPWPSLAAQIFDGKPISSGADVLAIDAPYRAMDAALVPVDISILPGADGARRVRRLTLVVDANPSPLAAQFEFGADAGIDHLSTRVRVNDYTNIHAVAEMTDGALLAVSRFVKAAGGCSAPALTGTANAIPLGTMRWRLLPQKPDAPAGTREAQLMIRHPNYSGMQMNQLTRLYIPADFIQKLRIWQGDRPLLAVAGGISLSENPEFRFRFRPEGTAPFRADAEDSKGHRFHSEFPAAAV